MDAEAVEQLASITGLDDAQATVLLEAGTAAELHGVDAFTVDLIGHAESSGLCGDDVRAFAMLPAAERERLMKFSGALTGGLQHVAPKPERYEHAARHQNGGSPAATRPLVSYEDDDNDAL